MPIHSSKAHGYVQFTLTAGTNGADAARAIRKDDVDHPTSLTVATVSFVEGVDQHGNPTGGNTVFVYIECPTENRANERTNLENWAKAVQGRLHTQIASHVTFCCISDE